MSENIAQTEKTRLRRLPKRGSYNRELIYQILDEAFICHIGFTIDNQPFVIPTGYARVSNRLLIHGSQASRMLRAMAGEIEVCVTVTLIDGLVLARSAFHHSMNYRSVVIFGRAAVVSDEAEKLAALQAFTEHILPGRWQEIRRPTKNELDATMVLTLSLEEASAKIRSGDPLDDEEDYQMDVWAGVIPLKLIAGAAIKDSQLPDRINLPDYIKHYQRPFSLLVEDVDT
ncbi:MAG: pyridoxamine 5'-phosphate oxidase family protein [Acidobacteriota bacterium]